MIKLSHETADNNLIYQSFNHLDFSYLGFSRVMGFCRQYCAPGRTVYHLRTAKIFLDGPRHNAAEVET